MRFELICVGNELLSGKVNTHIAYIGEKLATIGIYLDMAITTGDNLRELQSVLGEAFKRSNVVIVTGGLGPTFDDVTRKAVSNTLGKKLVFNREIMSGIARFFVERGGAGAQYKLWESSPAYGGEMPANNESQAYLIEGARAIQNKIGTAPGQIIEGEKDSPVIFLLPGPPKELHPMMEGAVMPYLKEKFELGILKKKILHVFGLPESRVDEIALPIIETERRVEGGAVSFTILEHISHIDVIFSVSGKDELLVDDMLKKIRSELLNVLGKNVYGEDSQTLESVVSELLLKKKKTLSVAESCTGGLLAHRITNIAGSSAYFKIGVEAYSNGAKINILGVNPETIEKYGAVSQQTALEMARGALSAGKSDIAVAVTGIAGPGGGTPEKPVGTVCFALVEAGASGRKPPEPVAETARFFGNRIEIKEKAASRALFILRNALI